MSEADKVLHDGLDTLNNFFFQMEGKYPKLPFGHAITKMKLQGEEIAELKKSIDWIRQTIHRAYHDQPMESCRQSVCAHAREVLLK